MSSLLVCAQPATGLADVLVSQERLDLLLKDLAAQPHLSRVSSASRLEARSLPETVSSGIAEIDALTGGLPRGCLTEIYGSSSSGRTSLLLACLAAATCRHEACALIDVSDALDPQSAGAAGVEFKNLLWIRCNSQCAQNKKSTHRNKDVVPCPLPTSLRAQKEYDDRQSDFLAQRNNRNQHTKSQPHKSSPELPGKEHTREDLRTSRFAWRVNRNPELIRLEQALKSTDLILQSGGFGLVAIDLGDLPLEAISRIPLTSWFRFRRAVENTATVLLVIAQGPCAKTCASLLLRLDGQPFLSRHPSALPMAENARFPNGWRTVGKHNFTNSPNFCISQQGMALMMPNLGASFPNCRSPQSALHEPAMAQQDIDHRSHAQLLGGMTVTAEAVRSRLERKPVQAARTVFNVKAAWAG